MNKKLQIKPNKMRSNGHKLTYAAMIAVPKFECDEHGGFFSLNDAHYYTALFQKEDIAEILGNDEQALIGLKDGKHLYFDCGVRELHKKMHEAGTGQDGLVDLCDLGLFNTSQDQKMTVDDVCKAVMFISPHEETHQYRSLFYKTNFLTVNNEFIVSQKPNDRNRNYHFSLPNEKGFNARISPDEINDLKRAAAIMQVASLDYRPRISWISGHVPEGKIAKKPTGGYLENRPVDQAAHLIYNELREKLSEQDVEILLNSMDEGDTEFARSFAELVKRLDEPEPEAEVDRKLSHVSKRRPVIR